jgi:hypothetical protein
MKVRLSTPGDVETSGKEFKEGKEKSVLYKSNAFVPRRLIFHKPEIFACRYSLFSARYKKYRKRKSLFARHTAS